MKFLSALFILFMSFQANAQLTWERFPGPDGTWQPNPMRPQSTVFSRQEDKIRAHYQST